MLLPAFVVCSMPGYRCFGGKLKMRGCAGKGDVREKYGQVDDGTASEAGMLILAGI